MKNCSEEQKCMLAFTHTHFLTFHWKLEQMDFLFCFFRVHSSALSNYSIAALFRVLCIELSISQFTRLPTLADLHTGLITAQSSPFLCNSDP